LGVDGKREEGKMAEQKENQQKAEKERKDQGTPREQAEKRLEEFYSHLHQCFSRGAMENGCVAEEVLYPDTSCQDEGGEEDDSGKPNKEETFKPSWVVTEDTILMTSSIRASGSIVTELFENRDTFVRFLDHYVLAKRHVSAKTFDFMILTRGYLYGYVSSVTLQRELNEYLDDRQVEIVSSVEELMKSDREVARWYRYQFRCKVLDDPSAPVEIGDEPIAEDDKQLFCYYVGWNTNGPLQSKCSFLHFKSQPVAIHDGFEDGKEAPENWFLNKWRDFV
jgi:hypothetical protein